MCNACVILLARNDARRVPGQYVKAGTTFDLRRQLGEVKPGFACEISEAQSNRKANSLYSEGEPEEM